ncbi:exodeoxyribonuclease VII large subunit [Chromatiales bacterium (ex Bugula neritina AB1)]|nr:exodeoxyribonuclease VII large subunit [Chromatiales bacterium (ex Bugula neritina AB1)]
MPLSPDHVFTVSELNSEVKWLLDTQFGVVWVEGELSNTMRARTGHMYFSVKDSRSQLRCAMFRNDNRRIDFTPQDGQKVLVRGRLGIYEARGDYQMVVDRMLEVGAGDLQAKFEQTKRRLHEEGLFDEQHKQSLPAFPRSIGLITSPTGAAVRDALNVLRRRCRHAQVIIYPATVQGATAAPSIARMLKLANKRNECDVLLLIRGGGSLEDLWAFNEEVVARSIFDSALPVISGIGHEIDFSIADLVADLRAPTPSAAAELCSPDSAELQQMIKAMQQRLLRQQENTQSGHKVILTRLQRRLDNHHPQSRLRQRAQRCDELELRLQRQIINAQGRARNRLVQLQTRLKNLSPEHQFVRRSSQLSSLNSRLTNSTRTTLQRAGLRLDGSVRALQAVSPLSTLGRGYAIVQTTTGTVVTNTDQVNAGEALDIRVSAGKISARVT